MAGVLDISASLASSAGSGTGDVEFGGFGDNVVINAPPPINPVIVGIAAVSVIAVAALFFKRGKK